MPTEVEQVFEGEPDEGSPPPLAQLTWIGSEVQKQGFVELEALPPASLLNTYDGPLMYRTRWYTSLTPKAAWSEFAELPAGGAIELSPTDAFYAGLSAHLEFPARVRLSVQLEAAEGRAQTLIADDFVLQLGTPLILMGSEYYSDVIATELVAPSPDSAFPGARVASVAPAAAKQISLEDYQAAMAAAAAYADEEDEG